MLQLRRPELRLDSDNLMDWIPPLFRDAMFSSPVTESSTVRFLLHPRLSPIYPATAVPLISPGHPPASRRGPAGDLVTASDLKGERVRWMR